MSRGFVDAGFEVAGAVEWDLSAAATYAANFGWDAVHCGDIKGFLKVPEVDVVIGGPPCQGFSNLGKRDPSDLRNGLWSEFVRVVADSKCDVFVLENVDRFARSQEHELLIAEATHGRLREYSVRRFTLNAADYGVPQRRIRTIVVGSRIGVPELPPATHGRDPSNDVQRWESVRSAIWRFVDRKPRRSLPEDRFFDIREGQVAGPFTLDEIHVGRNYQPKSIERYAEIRPGESRFKLPWHLQYDCWRRHPTGAADVLGRLEWQKPSVTIRTEFFKPEKGRYLHPRWSKNGTHHRALTHAEAAALQSFDDHHVWCGSKIEIARQIGNAVPPRLATAVAAEVTRLLASRVGRTTVGPA